MLSQHTYFNYSLPFLTVIALVFSSIGCARQPNENAGQNESTSETIQKTTRENDSNHPQDGKREAKNQSSNETRSERSSVQNPLLHPENLNEKAPDQFQVKFQTSRGPFTVVLHRKWAPRGVDRFYNLVKNNYFDECRFFRVIPKFVAQFGIHGDPEISSKWKEATIKDDPVKKSNRAGTITFAKAGPNSRTTQLFINLRDNSRLDKKGFPPIGKVKQGMDTVESLYGGYGGSRRGNGPDQQRIYRDGNQYLKEQFPKLDYIQATKIIQQK